MKSKISITKQKIKLDKAMALIEDVYCRGTLTKSREKDLEQAMDLLDKIFTSLNKGEN